MRTRLVGIVIAVALTATVLLVAPSHGLATVKTARWAGTFDVTQTYQVNTLNPEDVGEKETRTHIIKSTCAGDKACAQVTVSRVLGSGAKVTYKMRRVRPGVYRGVKTYDATWFCTRGGTRVWETTGPLTDTLTLTGVAQRRGKITKYRGTLRLQYVKYVVDDSVPADCQDHFESLGLDDGERPEVKLGLVARK